MRYSLDQLEIFSAVVEAGSFSAAARRQQRTQSSVSAAIANLEADLGVMLFDRSTRTPGLTEAGQRLLREVSAVLDRCLELERHAQSLAEAIEPGLALAIEVPYRTLTPTLAAFARQFPFVDLHIRNALEGDVLSLIHI